MANKPPFVGEKVKLGDVCTVNPRPPRTLSPDDAVSFLPLASVSTDGTTSRGIPSLRSEVCKGHPWFVNGDILVAKITPSFENGKIALSNVAEKDGYTSTEFHVIRPDSRKINEEFLLAFLRSAKTKQHCSARMKGSAGQKRVPAEVVKDLKLPLPSIKEQDAIAAQFRAINKELVLTRTLLDELDQLVKSQFVEMFGDPCDPAEANLPKQAISKFCELRIGPFGSALHKEDYVSEGHPIINPSHIVEGRVVIDSNLTISNEMYSSMAPYHLHIGDVVLGRRGEIGRCAVVEEEGLLCGTGSMILRPNSTLCRSDYLQRVVSFPSFAAALEREAVGVTMKNLNARIVGNATVVLPPLELQQEFADFVSQVDKSRFIARSTQRITM